jgi:hypothetical protein
MLGQKMLGSPERIFARACLSMFRNLEKGAQRSTVALAVVCEIAEIGGVRALAMRRLDCRTKSVSTKRPFHLQHVANLKKIPWNEVLYFPHPPRWVGLFKESAKGVTSFLFSSSSMAFEAI